MILKKILGDVSVADNGNGYTARHAGKSATCTSSDEGAMDAVLRKLYPNAKKFYYRKITLHWRTGKKPAYIFEAVSEYEEETL